MTVHQPDAQRHCPVLKMIGPFGRQIDIDTCTIVRFLLQPRMAAFVAMAVGLFVLLDALAMSDSLNFAQIVWIWTTTILLHILFRLGIDTLWALGQARFGLIRIWQPVLIHFAFALDSLQFTGQLALFTGVGFAQAFDPTKTLVGYLLTVVTELFYFTFVMPVLQARARTAAAEDMALPEPEPERRISAGGLAIPIDRLLVLNSAEHHVEVLAIDGAQKVRARLADMVAQTEPEDGVLAHRSHWVARRAIVGLTPGSGSEPDTLVLVTGERLKVARPRRAEVRDWARHYLPDAMRDAAERTVVRSA